MGEPGETVEEFVRRRLADELVDAGVPWQAVHCIMCGAPGVSASHECPPRPQELRGILDVPGVYATTSDGNRSITKSELEALMSAERDRRWEPNPEIVSPIELERRRRELAAVDIGRERWPVRILSETTWEWTPEDGFTVQHTDHVDPA